MLSKLAILILKITLVFIILLGTSFAFFLSSILNVNYKITILYKD